jgi:hypothetical protein
MTAWACTVKAVGVRMSSAGRCRKEREIGSVDGKKMSLIIEELKDGGMGFFVLWRGS